MTHALQSVHLGVDADRSAPFEVLKFCAPGGFQAKIVTCYMEAMGLHEGREEIVRISKRIYAR